MHADLGRYWYSISASLNRTAIDRGAQLEDALIDITIDKELRTYVNGMGNRGHFTNVHVAPASSADVPDEAGGVNAVFLSVAYPHKSRSSSEAFPEAKAILQHRGNSPRVYRNTLVFIAADTSRLDALKAAVRSYLAWDSIVNDTERLNLTQSEASQAKAKRDEERSSFRTRLKEAWHFLLYPYQETPQSDWDWSTCKVSAQNGALESASKELAKEEGLITELGPQRLNGLLTKHIWNDKPHLQLSDLWEYLNRYIYLPRVKNREVLMRTVHSAVSSLNPGPFAYAERWDANTSTYEGLIIDQDLNAIVTIDSDSVIVKPEIAEANRPQPVQSALPVSGNSGNVDTVGSEDGDTRLTEPAKTSTSKDNVDEEKPTRFNGTVMISPDRPASEIRNIIEGIVEQLTEMPGGDVTLKLEINSYLPDGIDKSKVRTLKENGTTLKFVDLEIN